MATFDKHCGNTKPHDPHSVKKRRHGMSGLRRISWDDIYRCGGTKSLNGGG